MCAGIFNYTSCNIFVGLGAPNYTIWDISAMTTNHTSRDKHASWGIHGDISNCNS
jgi:hypothetical protein